MRQRIFFLLAFWLVWSITFNFCLAKIETDTDKDGLSDYEEQTIYKTEFDESDTDGDGYTDGEEVYHGYSPLRTNSAPLSQVNLAVPYIEEAPDGNWTGPWKNACEEASLTMVEYYYLGSKTVSKTVSKKFMWNLFVKQDNLYCSNADSDAKRTTELINDYASFYAKTIDKPTLVDIKKELQQRRPVISLHYGFDLKNENIPFLATGSSYHMMVIIGYDDIKKEFITNDPGDMTAGQGRRYDYDLFLKTLHDFDFKTGKANGPARVIFTYPRLVRSYDTGRIYLLDINKNQKHYITSPTVFKTKKWSWDMVATVQREWLDSFAVSNEL